MRYSWMLTLVLLLAGCGVVSRTQGPPSAMAVEAAVMRTLEPYRMAGTVSVVGIRPEAPGGNVQVDLQFRGFQHKMDSFGVPVNKSTPVAPNFIGTYNESGIASLNHYADGRWVLTRIDFRGVFVGSNQQIQ